MLVGRGYRPIIDLPRNTVNLGRVCVGASFDTVATLRNIGNGALSVNNIILKGSSDFAINYNKSFQIDSNKSVQIPIKYTPTKIGDFSSSVYFASDGDWLFADTLLNLSGAGIICATVSVDKLIGEVGKTIDVPVRIKADSGLALTSSDIGTLMSAANKSDMDFSIAHKRANLRFTNEIPSGVIAGSANASVYPDSVAISVANNSTLANSDILGILKAEILLGRRLSYAAFNKT